MGTAVAIRYLIQVFPVSGPSLNPMLGTAWAVFAAGDSANTGVHFPTSPTHYLVYWAGPVMGGLFATFFYVVYAGGTFFGLPLPVGPLKHQAVAAKLSSAATPSSAATTTTKKSKKSNKKD